MPTETVLYTTLVGDDEPVEEIPADILTYGERLNRPGPLRISLAATHPTCRSAVIAAGRHEAAIRRNGQIVWRGPVVTVDEPPKPTGAPWMFTFGGEGLWHYPRRTGDRGWFVTSDLMFTGQDQFTIARALIDHHQAKAGGDFGFDTSDTSLSGVTRDRTYFGFDGKNIGEAVEQLAEVDDGFDFSIDPATRSFDLFYPKRGARKTDLIWDERNIRSFQRRIDSTKQASQVFGFGDGDAGFMLRRNRQSSGAVAEYRLTQGTYVNKDVRVVATLQAHVDRELSLFSSPAEIVAITVGTVEPPVFSYQVGDEGQVRWPSTYEPVNRFMRLVGRDITWQAGEEQAVLYLEDIG